MRFCNIRGRYGGCGPASFVYAAYLIVLLLHRDWRDDAKCAAKCVVAALVPRYTVVTL